MQGRRVATATAALLAAATVILATTAVAQESSTVVVSIEEACRNAASTRGSGDASYDYEQYCVSSLASDARSRGAADLRALAALATRIAAEHAASTGARMEGLSEVEESPRALARLHHCLELYSAAADALRDALDNIHARVYGAASRQLAAALGAAESCEDAWKGEERVPVTRHDREYGRMAMVALGLTSGIV